MLLRVKLQLELCGARSQENNTLAELNLKGNNLDDRAAVPLSEALRNSTSITKVDLSYNQFGEEAGKLFGEMLYGHSHLLDVNLKWNALKAKGGAAVAEGIKNNQVRHRACGGKEGGRRGRGEGEETGRGAREVGCGERRSGGLLGGGSRYERNLTVERRGDGGGELGERRVGRDEGRQH